MGEWMGNKESIVHIVHINGNETIFYSHVISFLFLYVLKTKANNSQSS